jgi:hypothetical protein
LFVSCKKEHASRIDIYILKSFTSAVDQSTVPATVSITNAVLENKPLVENRDILFYAKGTTTFVLKKDIQATIRDYGPDKAFAVTVDGQPIYYGSFHPMYLNSMTFGIATIAPFQFEENKLKIDFVIIEGNSLLQQLDKRNDRRIINALKATGRLR